MEIENLSFEDALKQLETIVRKLESGQATLEEAISEYEKGAALKKHCESRLNSAKMRIEKIVSVDSGGTPQTEPLE